MRKKNKICVIGLGYVGLTLSLHLAKKGSEVIGFDSNSKIINNLANYKTHILEKNIEKYLKNTIKNKKFTLADKIPNDCNTYIVTVGTPLKYDKKYKKFNSNLSDIKDISLKLSKIIKKNTLIIFRSTLPIGTCRNIIVEIFKENKLKVEKDYFLSFAPERTIEGNAIKELQDLPQIVSGYDKKSLKKVTVFFKNISNHVVQVKSLEAGEMIKLLNNSFRDLSFAFSNQVAMICNENGLDTNEIINSANKNYPRNHIPLASPGVGGPCLTKDPYILDEAVVNLDKKSKSIFTISRDINNKIVFNLINNIKKLLGKKIKKKILLCGLSFKGYPETKDYRGSVTLKFYEYLKNNKNYQIYLHDPLFTEKEIIRLLNTKSGSILNVSNFYDCIVIINNNNYYKKITIKQYSKALKKNGSIFDYWSLLKKNKNKLLKTNKQIRYFQL
jgi:UDP-N-acetyl-D-mannosaminuronic acid dehydrogenase